MEEKKCCEVSYQQSEHLAAYGKRDVSAVQYASGGNAGRTCGGGFFMSCCILKAVIAVIAAVPLGLALRPAVAKFIPKKSR